MESSYRDEFRFYEGGQKIVEYSGGGSAAAGDPAPDAIVASLITRAANDDLEKFDKWWAANKGRVALTANVKVQGRISATADKQNLIVFSQARPLRMEDFKGPVGDRPNEAAVTASGIGMKYKVETLNSQVEVDYTIYPNFNTESSWFRNSDENVRVLAHEQAHFEITALYACKLHKALMAARLTRDNFEEEIAAMQTRNSTAAIAEEDLYDEETAHGTIEDKQAQWQQKVKAEIKACGCY